MKRIQVKWGIVIAVLLIFTFGLLVIFFKNGIVNYLKGYQDSTIRSILEIIYFTASFFLLVVAIYGLKQLKITKENSQTNAKREAYRLVAERCTYYLESIIPKLNVIDKLMAENSIKQFGETKIYTSGDKLTIESKQSTRKHDKIIEMAPQIAEALNCLEAFSVFFTSGVAEENVAFSSIGSTYCNSVRVLLPLVCMAIEGGYRNVLKLYILWNDKIEKQKALQDKIKAESKLNNVCKINMKTLGT